MSDRLELYTPRPLGTKALQRLGDKLGSRADLTDAEQALYEEFIADARDRVIAVQTFVEGILPRFAALAPRLDEPDVVGRVKTRSTLTDKLERTPTENLPSIHDVAGVRVVVASSIAEQHALAHVMKRAFDDLVECSREALLIDRIEHPMHGYRALHLVVWPGGRPVEIQIRTQLQHGWAQTMEVLGDRWGREPRYGLPLVASSELERDRRERMVEGMKRLSGLIATYETGEVVTAVNHLNLSDQQLIDAGLHPDTLDEARRFARDHAGELEAASTALHALLRAFSKDALL